MSLCDYATPQKGIVKKDLTISVLVILAVVGICYAIAAMRPDLPLTPSQPFATKTGKPTKTGKVIMRINGEPVTEGEFLAFARSAPAEQRDMLIGSPEGRRLLANEIVKLKMLEQEADRLGVANDPEVRTQVEMTNGQIVAAKALEKLVKDKVDAYVRAEFEKEKANTFTLRHIVIAYAGGQLPSRDGSTRPVEQAMQKANAIATRLRGGADFATTARTQSDDQQSAMNGGSLGTTRREMLPPEIATVVGNLKSGEVSEPVRTPYGIHLFRVDQPTLEDLRPALLRNAQQKAVEETIAGLQKQAKVDLDPKYFPGEPGAKTAPPRPKS